MNICITINMKNKISKIKNLEIDYFEEARLSHLSENFYETIIKSTEKNIILLIEYRSIDSIKVLNDIKFKGKIITFIILYFEVINMTKYKNYKNIKFVNLKNKNYGLEILNKIKQLDAQDYKKNSEVKRGIEQKHKTKDKYRKVQSYKYNRLKNDVNKKPYEKNFSKQFKNNADKKQQQTNNLQCYNNLSWNRKSNPFIKSKISKRTIVSFSLDNKVYATTYLLNYCIILNEKSKSEINLFEKEQSLIRIDKLIDLNKNNIKYKKFSIIDMISVKNKNINVIDFGRIDNLDVIKEIMQNEYLKIIVFTTDCLKVNENDKYLKTIRFLEKHNEVVIINRHEIFDRKIQEYTNKFKSKTITKSIKKNKLLRRMNV